MWRRKPPVLANEGGLQGPGTREAGWRLAHGLEGWLVLSRPFPLTPGQHPLAIHASWAGPFKLVGMPGRAQKRAELFLGPRWGNDSSPLDSEAPAQAQTLGHELLALAAVGEQPEGVAGWEPPEAPVLAAWLSAAGWEPTIDSSDRLGLTLRRPGCDGRLRIERAVGKLRLVLPLGHWPQLEPGCERAMVALAARVNASIRMARICWGGSGVTRHCEAQVDLSGLRLPDSRCPWRESLWVRWLARSVAALELALRQLGLELAILADPAYRSLAERVTAECHRAQLFSRKDERS